MTSRERAKECFAAIHKYSWDNVEWPDKHRELDCIIAAIDAAVAAGDRVVEWLRMQVLSEKQRVTDAVHELYETRDGYARVLAEATGKDPGFLDEYGKVGAWLQNLVGGLQTRVAELEAAVYGHCQTIDDLNHEVVMLRERVAALEAVLSDFPQQGLPSWDWRARREIVLRKDS